MKNNDILRAIEELRSINTNRASKYRRNLRKYHNTPGINIDNLSTNSAIVGYTQNDSSWAETVLPSPNLNIIKSIIDTLTSKIAQSKVRPFFNTMNGSYKDMQVALQAQHYFDLYFEEQNLHNTVAEAFRDACIFDTGIVYVNEAEKTIKKCLPWQVFVRPAELAYNKLTRVYYEQKDFPVTLIPDSIRSKFKNKNCEYCDYGIYYDIFNKVKAHIIAGHVVSIENYYHDRLPFIFLYYSKPEVGTTSASIVDILYTLQNQIDMIMGKISTSSELTPANTVFLPEGSSIKAGQLNNGVGNVVTYKISPNMTGSPVTIATPAFIDVQYQALLQEYIQKAYELVGISQMSAMSVKPQGLDSGVALSTMENIESDRFETQLKQVINSYTDIAKVCIEIFDSNENILPESNRRLTIKWKDIQTAAKTMKIQFSAADALSKDPSTKLQQLQTLAASGVIPASRIAQLMELPDIQSGYSLTNNAVNAVYAVINDCIENNNFALPDYVPFTMLKEEIINVQLSLKAANHEKNEEDIAKLQKLYTVVEDKEMEFAETAAQQEMDAMNAENGTSSNVLTQEANTYNVADSSDGQEAVSPKISLTGKGYNEDLDVATSNDVNGAWNSPYSIANGRK